MILKIDLRTTIIKMDRVISLYHCITWKVSKGIAQKIIRYAQSIPCGCGRDLFKCPSCHYKHDQCASLCGLQGIMWGNVQKNQTLIFNCNQCQTIICKQCRFANGSMETICHKCALNQNCWSCKRALSYTSANPICLKHHRYVCGNCSDNYVSNVLRMRKTLRTYRCFCEEITKSYKRNAYIQDHLESPAAKKSRIAIQSRANRAHF